MDTTTLRRARRARSLAAAAALAALASLVGFQPTALAAPGPSVTIERVDGRSPGADGVLPGTVSADVLDVRGTAEVDPAPVADAGSSPRVPVGAIAPLTGNASYGTPGGYTFAWTHEGSSSRFTSADAQNTGFDTAGLSPGAYTVQLSVTDASGRVGTDTVKVAVFEARTGDVILDETYTSKPGTPDDVQPNADGADQTYAISVPARTSKLVVSAGWASETSDFDLYVMDPSGAEAGRSAGAANPEVATLIDPRPAGTWKVLVRAYLTPGEPVDVTAVIDHEAGPDIPTLSSAAPFVFQQGDPQRLTATVGGGTGPLTTAWDLDGDAIYESPGTGVTARYPLGTHLAAVKVTDAAGFEVKQVVPVKVVAAGDTSAVAPIVVVGVTDSGLNVYHKDWRATTYPDPRVLALTRDFTRDPAEYIRGYPAGTPAIPITLSTGWAGSTPFPPQDASLWTRANIPAKALRWIPGTKIVGVYDTDAGSGVTSGADTYPILDENGHGTASASVAVGNIYGFCPTCLLVAAEGLDADYVVSQSWIDISSNSFGARGNIGFAGQLGGPTIPKEVAEAGKLTLFAAGNGNENAFITPEQTYINEHLGPAWSIRVGAIERGSRKPIVGTGKPVDVSSFGSGNIPSAGNKAYDDPHQHSGTSAATPYTAGVFGTVLSGVRERLGDGGSGQGRFVEPGSIAKGASVSTSPYLHDGVLTAAEIREAIFKTAQHDTGPGTAVLPTTTPSNDNQYAIEGYGIVEPASGARALDVLLGRTALPTRPAAEEDFFAKDRAIRDEIWGTWDGGGTNSRTQAGAPAPTTPPAGGSGIPGETFAARIATPTDGTVIDPAGSPTIAVGGPSVFPAVSYADASPTRLYAHRPRKAGATAASCVDDLEVLTTSQATGDTECTYTFQSGGEAIEPLGLQPVDSFPLQGGLLADKRLATGAVTGQLSMSGTGANARVEVEVRLVAQVGSSVRTVGQQRVVYTALTATTAMPFSFPLDAAAAGAGTEGLRLDIAFISSAGLSTVRLNNGTYVNVPLVDTSSLPVDSVELAVDDPGFASPVVATLSADHLRWSVPSLPVVALAPGAHRLYVRPLRDGVAEGGSGHEVGIVIDGPAEGFTDGVQVQLTREGTEPSEDGWKPAIDDTAGYSVWHSAFDLRGLPAASDADPGRYVVHSRLLRSGDVVSLDDVTFVRAAAEPTPAPDIPEVPFGALLPVLGLVTAAGGAFVLRRRRG